jgi:hypothetical protein
MIILYPQLNNKLAVLVPCGNVSNSIKDIPENVEYKVVESFDFDDSFFDAYEFDKNVGAKINIEKAKEIHYNRLRSARKPLLEKLDLEFMLAVEKGDINLQKEIASKKQVLRDITLINLSNNLDEIKNTWPDVLTV